MSDTTVQTMAIETEDLWRIYKTGSQEVAALRGINIHLFGLAVYIELIGCHDLSPIFRAGMECRRQPRYEFQRQTAHALAVAKFSSFRLADAPDSRPKELVPLPRDASTGRAHPYFHCAIDQ